MPLNVLTPSIGPPMSNSSPGSISARNPPFSLQKSPKGHASSSSAITQDSKETINAIVKSRIPRVNLDSEVVTGGMAAHLATSLLGHILFLKSQVPFPVMQLARIPLGGKSNPRATKMRTELVSSFDTISSHLISTFSALSTALAKCSSKTPPTTSQAFLAILVGPSIGTARSKVVFAVDGFQVQVWGTRPLPPAAEESDSSDEEEEEDSDEEEEDSDDESPSDSESSACSDSIASDSPPPSRSPSPVPPRETGPVQPSIEIQSPPPLLPSLSAGPIVHHSSAQEDQTIRAADRLLSRTLAEADAEGYGMAAELAPTQTHVLIRAPRRFAHPAWIPQQNVASAMEGVLDEFLAESGHGTRASGGGDGMRARATKKARRGHVKVEGVWVGPRSGGGAVDGGESMNGEDGERKGGDAGDLDEDDEMIWWSWDGKIVGFADW